MIIAGKQIEVGENKSNFDTYEPSAQKTDGAQKNSHKTVVSTPKTTAVPSGTTESKSPRRASNGLTMADAHKIYDAMCKKYDKLSKDTSVADSLLEGSNAQTHKNKTKNAAKGAAIGTALFPGLGTVVGGIIGWLRGT